MKRKIAIVLTALSIALCLVACGVRNDSTVSKSTNGRIEDGRMDTQRNDRNSSQSTTKNFENRTAPEMENGVTRRFMDDMKDAANNAGDAIGDAGRAIGDVMTGQQTNRGSGMTGIR